MRIVILYLLLFTTVCSCSLAGGSGGGTGENVTDTDIDTAEEMRDESERHDADDGERDDESAVYDEDSYVPLEPMSVCFDNEIRGVFLDELAAATESVIFVTFQFRDSTVMRRLNELHDDGVTVRGVVGASIDEDVDAPRFDLTELHDQNGSGGIMHEKFMIIDGKTLLITTANMAFTAIKNSLIVYRDGVDGAEYEDTISLLTHEFSELSAGRTGHDKDNRCSHGCDVEIGTLYFSPGAGCEALAGRVRDTAGENSYLALYHMTDAAEELYDALRDILSDEHGLTVILDDWGDGEIANDEIYDALRARGADAYIYDGSMVWHHKFFVNDTLLEFGSMNWTYSGCNKNDELFYISENDELKQRFQNYFEDNLSLVQ